jgi:hypothetical protein
VQQLIASYGSGHVIPVPQLFLLFFSLRKFRVHNEIRDWNCQDYVLDFLDAIEEEDA